jgi:hypothetical protein
VNEHLEAIDYDLLTLGCDIRDLGTSALPWYRLRAIVTYLPPTSALARSIHGEKALWTTTDHLLAAAVDALASGNWQRGGGKGKRPKPLPRPGETDAGARTMGTGRMTVQDAQTFFERINRG